MSDHIVADMIVADMTATSTNDINSPAEIRDTLPADLDTSTVVESYVCPNNSRRRIPGVLYLLIGAGSISIGFVFSGNSVLINEGFLIGGLTIILFGLYHLQAGWHLVAYETDALTEAVRSVGFPVGHASAQLAWRGLRSRPTWRIILYSSEPAQEFPKRRGLVLVDGVTGSTVECFVEENPEDWSIL